LLSALSVGARQEGLLDPGQVRDQQAIVEEILQNVDGHRQRRRVCEIGGAQAVNDDRSERRRIRGAPAHMCRERRRSARRESP